MGLNLNYRIKQLRYFKSMGAKFSLSRLWAKITSPRPMALAAHLPAFSGLGLEIGGPSSFFGPTGPINVYSAASSIDNVTFSSKTHWEGQLQSGQNFQFNPNKPCGYQYLLDSNSLSKIESHKYDFVISCHMLEHTANPLKALYEWKRVLKPKGMLLLILPHHKGSFDHRREVTSLDHMISDYDKNTPEDDTTHFDEILLKHDLTRDIAQKSPEAFRQWILDNKTNRGAHHHVFNPETAAQLVNAAGFQVLETEVIWPLHICILSKNSAP